MRTYNPILEVRNVGLMPPRPPALGRTMVLLARDGTLVTVAPGGGARGGWLSGFRVAYVIDTSEHQLAIAEHLRSSNLSLAFEVVIRCSCRVAKPAEVAERQLDDVGAVVRAAVVPVLQAASSTYDVLETAGAQRAMAVALSKVVVDRALEVTGLYVDLPISGEAATKGTERIGGALLDETVASVRHKSLEGAIASGKPGLLAHHLARNPTDSAAAIDMIAGGEVLEAENMLRAIALMFGTTSKDDEGLDTWEARKALMDRFVHGALSSRPTAGPTPSLGSRGSRVRGSLMAGSGDPGRRPEIIDAEEVEPERRRPRGEDRDRAPDDRPEPDARGDDAPRPSRLRLPSVDGRPGAARPVSHGRLRDPDEEA